MGVYVCEQWIKCRVSWHRACVNLILARCAYTDPSALEKCTKAAVSALRSATTVPHSFASVAAAAAAAAIVVAGSVRNAPV